MTNGLGHARRGQNGSAFVELALSLPVLMVVLVGAADFARVLYMGIELTNAARAGAQYGAHNLTQSGDITTMRSTAIAAAPNITGMTATPTQNCRCATNSGTFSALAGGTTCSDPPTTSCPGKHRVMMVTVQTQATFTIIARNIVLPRTLTLTRTATQRVVDY